MSVHLHSSSHCARVGLPPQLHFFRSEGARGSTGPSLAIVRSVLTVKPSPDTNLEAG